MTPVARNLYKQLDKSRQAEDGALTEFANGAGRKRIPLWHRIEGVLRHKIATGEYRAGSALPSEHELAAGFGVSRMTVREAMRSLSEQGLLRQIQGKGTFVLRGLEPPSGAGIVTGFVGEHEFNGAFPALSPDPSHKTPRCSHIDLSTVEAPPRVAELLCLTESTVVRAERAVVSPHGSFGYVLDYLPHEIGDRIGRDDLDQDWLTQVLPNRLGIPVLEARETIEATLADVVLSQKLDVPFGAPLLYTERLYLGVADRRLYVAHIWRRADRFRFAAVYRFQGQTPAQPLDATNDDQGGRNVGGGSA